MCRQGKVEKRFGDLHAWSVGRQVVWESAVMLPVLGQSDRKEDAYSELEQSWAVWFRDSTSENVEGSKTF